MFLVVCTYNIESTEEDGDVIADAEDGQHGANNTDLPQPNEPSLFDDQSQIINDYKNYVREHLANHFLESKLRKFLSDLNENESVQSQYSSLGFVDELLGMENQYFKLREQLPFDPFVASLRHRIDEYAMKQAQHLSKEDKQLLGCLRAATLSKLCSVQSTSKHVSTVDLAQYLELIHSHIAGLEHIKKIDAINKHRKRFADSIKNKVDSAKVFIEQQLIPNIDETMAKINDQITTLIRELKEKRKTLEAEQRLKEAMHKQRILFWLKVVGVSILALSISGVILGLITQIPNGSSAPIYGNNLKCHIF